MATYAIGDVQGCRLEDGNVFTPDGYKEAWKKIYEAGWKSIGVQPEFGAVQATEEDHDIRFMTASAGAPA